MYVIDQLKRILNTNTPNSGKVVENGNSLTVATRQGTISVPKLAGDATPYKVGDTVVISNGVLVGRRIKQPQIYVI